MCAKLYFPTISSAIPPPECVIPSCSTDEEAYVLNGFIVSIFISTLPAFYVTEVANWFSRDRFTFAKCFNDNVLNGSLLQFL